MDRLTELHYKKSDGYYMKCSGTCTKDTCECCGNLWLLLQRLGAYEDTGMGPEDILCASDMAKVACALHELNKYKEILGGGCDLDRLRELVEVDQKKGQPVWVIERDEDGDPADVVGCIFVTAVSGVAIVSAYIHGCQDFESILLDKTDETWRNGECDLAAYPLVDCCWSKEAAERALWGAENET